MNIEIPPGWESYTKHGYTWVYREGESTGVSICIDNERGLKYIWDGEYPHTAEDARQIGKALIACADLFPQMPGVESA